METTSGKPGWKKTEFWGKIGIQLMTLWGAVAGFVPPKYALIVTTGVEAIYGICRTISKAVSDIQTAKADSTTSTIVTPAATTVTTTTAG